MAKKQKRTTRRVIVVPTNCEFCKSDSHPDYKDWKTLGRYMTDRAKIIGKDRSGLCTKHQRQLGTAVKRARHLALLPFASSL